MNATMPRLIGDRDSSSDLAYHRSLFGLPRIKQLLHTRQSQSNIPLCVGYTAGVEGAHGKLGARLTNGLCRDDANSDTKPNQLARGQISAITELTDAVTSLALQRGANRDSRDC